MLGQAETQERDSKTFVSLALKGSCPSMISWALGLLSGCQPIGCICRADLTRNIFQSVCFGARCCTFPWQVFGQHTWTWASLFLVILPLTYKS